MAQRTPPRNLLIKRASERAWLGSFPTEEDSIGRAQLRGADDIDLALFAPQKSNEIEQVKRYVFISIPSQTAPRRGGKSHPLWSLAAIRTPGVHHAMHTPRAS